MLNFLPGPVIGFLSLILYVLNTILWILPILLFSLLKAIFPFSGAQKLLSYLLDAMASNWIAFNTIIQKLFTKLDI